MNGAPRARTIGAEMNRILPFERLHEPILSPEAFRRRLVAHALLAAAIVTGSLGIGVLGYRVFEGLSWLDAFLNAAMILGGEGPVNDLHSAAGKLFAALYALYSGIVFLAIATLLVAPIAHRLLHHVHLSEEERG